MLLEELIEVFYMKDLLKSPVDEAGYDFPEFRAYPSGKCFYIYRRILPLLAFIIHVCYRLVVPPHNRNCYDYNLEAEQNKKILVRSDSEFLHITPDTPEPHRIRHLFHLTEAAFLIAFLIGTSYAGIIDSFLFGCT